MGVSSMGVGSGILGCLQTAPSSNGGLPQELADASAPVERRHSERNRLLAGIV